MIANYERNLKAIDSGRVTKDLPPPPKKRVKGSIRGISEILSPCDKENNSARYTERRIEVFFFYFFFGYTGSSLLCSAFLDGRRSRLLSSCGPRLLTAVASPVAEHGLRGFSTLAHGLPTACGIFPNPGWNPDPLH